VDALIRGDEVFLSFYIDNAKGSRTDSGFDDRRDRNGIRMEIFRSLNLKCLGCRDSMGLCKLYKVFFISNEFDLLQIRTEEISILRDFRMIFCQYEESLFFHWEKAIIMVFFNLFKKTFDKLIWGSSR
jgi:hypothetical protein